MLNRSNDTGPWLDAVVCSSVRVNRLAALGHCVLGLVALVAWFMLLFTVSFVARLFGSPFNPTWFAVIVIVAQFIAFAFVRRPALERWQIAPGVDPGEIIAVAPDNSQAQHYAYNQDHGFSFKRAYFALFLAAPVALDEAFRDWREGTRLKRLQREPAARLAALLLTEQKKVTFDELANHWRGDDLVVALQTAAELPAFQMFGNEPQGVALSNSAIDQLLAA